MHSVLFQSRVYVAILWLYMPLMYFMPLAIEAQDAWTLRKDQEGIKVYTRNIPGESFQEYRAVTEIDASPDILIALFYKADKNPEWVYQVSESERLEETDGSAYFIHSTLEAPWLTAI